MTSATSPDTAEAVECEMNMRWPTEMSGEFRAVQRQNAFLRTRLNFEDYQKEAMETAVYPERYKVIYSTMGLAGEAGEVANKVKKIYRDRGGEIDDEARQMLCGEIGDVLWYCAALCSDLGTSLDIVAEANLKKLRDRKKRDALQGSGDAR